MNARVILTGRYERQAKRLLSSDEKDLLQSAIAADTEAHPIVSGTGGVRKARWGRDRRGKSGGVRVIYYYWAPDTEVYMLSIYAKNEQPDMSADDRRVAKSFVEILKDAKKKKLG